MLRILTFHRVARPERHPRLDPELVSATPEAFRSQMRHVARHYRPVSLEEVIEAFHGGRPLPARAVHITFDDAYRNFQEHAWPTLRELGIPVTAFVPTAFPGRPALSLWWDRMYRTLAANGAGGWDRAVVRAAIAESEEMREMSARTARTMLRELPYHEAERLLERLCPEETQEEGALLDWDEIRSLAREGVTFGAHTRHHVALTRTDEERARLEMRESLADLRRELGDIPSVMAYPYGMYDEHTLEMAREAGCVLGFTCDDGLNGPGRTDPLRLCRTNITRRTTRLLFPVRMLPWFAYVDRWRHRGEQARLRT